MVKGKICCQVLGAQKINLIEIWHTLFLDPAISLVGDKLQTEKQKDIKMNIEVFIKCWNYKEEKNRKGRQVMVPLGHSGCKLSGDWAVSVMELTCLSWGPGHTNVYEPGHITQLLKASGSSLHKMGIRKMVTSEVVVRIIVHSWKCLEE